MAAVNKTALFVNKQAGGVFNIQDIVAHPGNVWFVDSGHTNASDSASYGRNPEKPFATLDYAVGNCTASNGDVIYVMPGHAEAIAADSDVDIDVAGVKVIGLGWGATRPTFTFGTATTADFKLAAASVHVENILFLGGIDALSGPVEITGADCVLKNCEYRDVTGQATDVVMVVDGADRLLIDGLRVIGAAAAGGNSAIAIDGSDDTVVRNCYVYGNFAVGAIDFRTHASARVNVHDCTFWTENAADIAIIDTVTGSTGFIGPRLQIMLQDNGDNITEACTGATFQYIDPIYICNLAGEKAMLTDITASTSA